MGNKRNNMWQFVALVFTGCAGFGAAKAARYAVAPSGARRRGVELAAQQPAPVIVERSEPGSSGEIVEAEFVDAAPAKLSRPVRSRRKVRA